MSVIKGTKTILKVSLKYIKTLKYPSIVYLWIYPVVLVLAQDQDQIDLKL